MAVTIGITVSMIVTRSGEMTTVYVAMILDWNNSERTHKEPVIAHIFSSREIAEEWIRNHYFREEFWIEEHKVQDSSEI